MVFLWRIKRGFGSADPFRKTQVHRTLSELLREEVDAHVGARLSQLDRIQAAPPHARSFYPAVYLYEHRGYPSASVYCEKAKHIGVM